VSGPGDPCRLCGGATRHLFDKTVLARHRVSYWLCEACGSQQTDQPTWLDEAYAIPGVHIDVGGATRTLKNWVAVATLLDLVGLPNTSRGVDFGSASGLFPRLMRSIGREFLAQDKYAYPSFANYFMVDDPAEAAPRVLTAFEVFEHLPEPRETLDDLLGLGADYVVFSTWFVDGQGEDWIYYLPECGQHVFFYSDAGFRALAERHGYALTATAYFYVLAHRDRVGAAGHAAVLDFAYHAEARVAARIPDLVSGVILSNPAIEAEFMAASARFAAEREGDVAERRARFGPDKA
jgi:hypothetical protein